MRAMKISARGVLTVVAALVVLGGLFRLSSDTRRAEVAMPDADGPALPSTPVAPSGDWGPR
jgi:hypothetical protein